MYDSPPRHRPQLERFLAMLARTASQLEQRADIQAKLDEMQTLSSESSSSSRSA